MLGVLVYAPAQSNDPTDFGRRVRSQFPLTWQDRFLKSLSFRNPTSAREERSAKA
jgi:hypothetical protein